MRIFILNFFIGRHGIYSEISCCGDYSRIFADATCPVVADTPEVGKCPTDFTDLHRFFLGTFFFCHADFVDDADFFSWDFIIGRHGIYSEISCCGDYSRIFADATCPVVADTPEVGKSPTDLHRFFLGRFFVTQISQMTQIFFSSGFFSSDDTEFIQRFPAVAITHGFSQMRPVRSLQIPPEVGQRDSPEIP